MSKIQTEKTQLRKLYNQILGRPALTGNDVFHVFPIEASVGKTYIMKRALVDLYSSDPNVKSLVITLFTKEADAIESDINAQAGKSIAIAHHSKNNTKAIDCVDYPIVIITHAKYKTFCSKSFQRREDIAALFTKRTNLIIDEEVDLLVTWGITAYDIEFIEMVLKERSQKIWSRYWKIFYPVCFKIMKFSVGPINMRFWGKDAYSISSTKAISLIKKLKTISFKDEFFVDFEKIHGYKKAKIRFYGILNSMQNVLDNPKAIIDKTGLYCCNKSIKAIMLENNIILDASASINATYQSKFFNVRPMKRIVDHSNWMLCLYELSSTDYYKKNNPMFYQEVCDYIVKRCSSMDKALVLCKKREKPIFEKAFKNRNIESTYAIVNFMEMRGKNDWSDYNKCFVVHIPYEPFRNYVFRYMLFNPGMKLTDHDIITGMRGGGTNGFLYINELDELKESAIISSIYQGIKRINRDNSKTAEVFVVTNKIDMFKQLSNEFRNIARKRVIKPLIARSYKQRRSKYADALLMLFQNKIAENASPYKKHVVVRKDEFSSKLGCSRIGVILKNQEVADYMKDNNISNCKKTFIFD